jgi:N-acetylgalactosamine-N,N'-diacetylbacillosaminyl-diphospho-undecaprenol 4-alpha-N-acetylgalactosaminyltransferase
MKKKIAIFTYSLEGGGAERTVANLLDSLDRNKYDIHLILMNTNIMYVIPPDQKIHFIAKANPYEQDVFKFLKMPWYAFCLARYCRKEKIQLIFSVMNRPNMIATMAKKWFGLKAKVIISEQFYTPYLYNRNTYGGKFKVWLLKKCYVAADCIMPNSRGTIKALQQQFNINTDYELIKNPTNVKEIIALKNEAIEEAIDFKKFTFINVSAFRPEKNHNLILNAVAKLSHRDFQLVFIGKGPLLNEVKIKVKELGLERKVFFIPFTNNPFKYLYQSSCFILSSFAEGFPNILIESMVCELPIISVDCKTGPRELLAPKTDIETKISNGKFEIAEYGLLCEVDSISSLVSAMEWAMDNSEKLKIFSLKALPQTSEFDLEKVANDLSLIFDKYLVKRE